MNRQNNFPPFGMDDRLREALEFDITQKQVRVSSEKLIQRAHYAKLLGCSLSRLSSFAGIFAEFERRITLTDVKPNAGLAGALRSLLLADSSAGKLPSSRGGKIDRRYYANKLGCTPSALTRFVPIFAEFEQRFNITTKMTRHLPNMRAWLKEAFEAGELAIRDGKIDRTVFAKQFGLRGQNVIGCHPEIRALFEEYDARAERERYLPSVQVEELQRLREVLAADPELASDRITISAVKLSKAAEIPRNRLQSRYFAEAIAQAQAQITTLVMASKIDPYFHDRVFWFSGLAATWGTEFIQRVALRFKQVVSCLSKGSSGQPYLSLRNALSWIGASANPHCVAVLHEARKVGRITDAGEWEDALFAYRDQLVEGISRGNASDSTVNMRIFSLRTSLDALATGAVIPRTANSLPGVKYSRRRAGHLRSVAEVPRVGRGATSYIDFARKHFESTQDALEIKIGWGDSDSFFASIGEELRITSEIPEDPAEAIKILLQRRLEALRSKATAIVDEAAVMYERGRKLLSISTIDSESFEKLYLGQSLNSYQRALLLKDIFPCQGSSDEHVEMGMANLLALIEQKHGGVPPSSTPNPLYGQLFARRYRDYGGITAIETMLIPDARTVGAALTLYLIDSGANVSVGRTLNRECSEKSDLAGYRRITGHKARAQGKPIIVDLPEEASSVRAIDWLLSAGCRLPEQVKNTDSSNSDRDRLFLMRLGGRVQLMTPHWYTNWFKEFASSITALKDLRLTPNMIRPSVLLHASLSNDGRLMTGMAWAQHTEKAAQGYQQKWPTRLRYDQLMRQFLGSFESLVMKNVPEAAEKLGITPEEFEARLGNLQATGLGTFCRDGRGRPGSYGASCSTVDCWNDCPHMLIVAEVEAIASLQLWQTALRQAQPEMERDHPERWDKVWLPWLCLTDVVEENMVRGMIAIWNSASRRACEIASQPDYVPARPW